MVNLILILMAFFLVLLNGFFVAAEFGMVKLRHTRVAAIKTKYGFRGRILSHVHHNLDAYLSACQLGITLTSLGLGWIGEPALARLLEPMLSYWKMFSRELTLLLSFLIAFSFLSFLHIVVGELVPKSLAIRQSERVSLWTATPLYFFYWAMYPAIWVLNACASAILKAARLDELPQSETGYSPDEIKLILSASHLHGQITPQEIKMLKHTLEFNDLKVVDVMRPFDEMVTLDAELTIDEAIKLAMVHRYSRYPIYFKKNTNIIGIVHVKDLLQASHQNRHSEKLQLIMRPILKVSRRLRAISLLNKLQEGMPHFALIYSGRESPIGFVTLDHLFQVLVGRVRDEFHNTDEAWTVAVDGAFMMSGSSPLYVVERALDIEIEVDDEEEPIDTIYGLILTHLGRLPTEGERIEFKQFDAVVTSVSGYKIKRVAVYPKKIADAGVHKE